MNDLIINGIDHSVFDLEWAKRGGVVYHYCDFCRYICDGDNYNEIRAGQDGECLIGVEKTVGLVSILTIEKIENSPYYLRMATPDECAAAGVEYMAPPMRWLPIESASMDGTLILLYTDSGAITVGQFDSLLKYWRYDYDNADGHDKPTHWMSLPQPPVTLSKSGSNE